MIVTIFIFLLILAVLVLAHEMGHFIMARRNGVIADEFGFGFPPRVIGTYKDKDGKRRWVFGNREIEEEVKHQEETVFSINLIPLGGFVKIKGEDGEGKDDPSSFAAKSIWQRFQMLVAGVVMNFILGILLLIVAFWMGLPEMVEEGQNVPGAIVQIAQVMPKSPAQQAGIQLGDEILAIKIDGQEFPITEIQQFQDITKQNAGKEMIVKLKHPDQNSPVELKVTPRAAAPEGQGLLGVMLAKTAIVRHSFFESVWLALKTTYNLIIAIISFLGMLIAKLFTARPVSNEVAGPVGIAVMTGQAAKLGLAYLFQFAAMLSINLAVINIFPLPALDGGRIFFLLVEKIKGSPISQKMEGILHTTGFVVLLALMLLITIKDFFNFGIVDKIKGLF